MDKIEQSVPSARSGLEAFLRRCLGALPGGSAILPASARLASLADQALLGGSNLLAIAVIAHSLPSGDLATIGTAIGIHYFAFAVHRGLVALPFVITVDTADIAAPFGAWWRFNLAVVAALALALLSAAGALQAIVLMGQEGWAWFARSAWLAAAISPALILGEFGRRWFYQQGMPLSAAFGSGCYALVNVGVAALGCHLGSVTLAGLAWLGAGLAAGTLAYAAAPPPLIGSWRDAFAAWRPHARFAVWQTAVALPNAIYNVSPVILFGWGCGPTGAAIFTAVRTVVNPANSIASAVDSLDKPRAASAHRRAGINGLKASVSRTRWFLCATAGGYLALVALLGDRAVTLVGGEAYAGHATILYLLVAATFLTVLNQPSETFLVVRQANVSLFVIRAVNALAATIAVVGLGQAYGLAAAAAGLVAVQAINLAGLRLAEHRIGKSDERPKG